MANSFLAVEDLAMSFGGLVALDGVTFQVKPGEITALIGPNGAGKTTVFNCLTGFYRPTSGKIFLHKQGQVIDVVELLGRPFTVNDLLPQRLLRKLYYKMFGGTHRIIRQGIARTFQNTRLFKGMTVMENLLVAQHQLTNSNLLAGVFKLSSYQQAERRALANAYRWLREFGLVTEANRLAGQLPYGQQKKLEIIRALCTEPQLICFDEPAAGLNTTETDELAQLIKQICYQHGITVFIIEHDMSLVMEISDHVVVLDSGSVICCGRPEQVRTDPKVLSAYLGSDGST